MAAMLAGEILAALVRVNLAAGTAIVLVLLLRKFARPVFGARVGYALWLLPVLAGAAVLAPAREVFIAAPPVAALPDIASSLFAPLPAAGGSLAAHAPAPSHIAAAIATGAHLDVQLLILAAWLAGVVGAALVMAWLQRRFIAEVGKGAVGPAVLGVIAPRIVTPRDFEAKFSGDEQALVLAHERAHIDRQDSRLNGLSAALQCLCWFNPLIHLGAHLMRIDQEMACDEAVIARRPEDRRAYAQALVKAQLAIRPLPLGCYWPSRTQHPLYERIAMLKRDDFSRARRLTGASALALISAATGLAAWASQPADVRIAAAQSVVEPTAVQAANAPRSGAAVPAQKPETALPDIPAFAPARPIQLAQAQTAPPAAAATSDQTAAMLAEQQAPRKVVPFDPTRFDKFVGSYEIAPNAVFKITRDGDKLFTQLTGQGPVQVYPESETKFFATVVAAQISFNTDAQGRVTELVLHQNGREQHAHKIDEATAKTVETALAERIKDQKPAPGGEAAIRRNIDEVVRGQPDYDALSPALAAAMRQQLPVAQARLAALGALQSVTFKGVGPNGVDRYEVVFAMGATEWQISMGPDGKVQGLGFRATNPSTTKQIVLSAAALDQFVGDYHMSPDAVLRVTRDGDHLATFAAGFPSGPVYPGGERTFFSKTDDRQITFSAPVNGKSSELVEIAGGFSRPGKRIDEAEAQAQLAARTKRYAAQTPIPGSDAVLRRLIDGLQRGQPQYDQMSPTWAAFARTQAPQLQATLASLGALKSLKFNGVGPGGFDIYEVAFANGTEEWRIGVTPDGKVDGWGIRLTP